MLKQPDDCMWLPKGFMEQRCMEWAAEFQEHCQYAMSFSQITGKRSERCTIELGTMLFGASTFGKESARSFPDSPRSAWSQQFNDQPAVHAAKRLQNTWVSHEKRFTSLDPTNNPPREEIWVADLCVNRRRGCSPRIQVWWGLSFLLWGFLQHLH